MRIRGELLSCFAAWVCTLPLSSRGARALERAPVPYVYLDCSGTFRDVACKSVLKYNRFGLFLGCFIQQTPDADEFFAPPCDANMQPPPGYTICKTEDQCKVVCDNTNPNCLVM